MRISLSLLLLSFIMIIASCNKPASQDVQNTQDSTKPDIYESITVQDKGLFIEEEGKIYILDNPKVYVDEKFRFSVQYPADWKTKIEETWEATAEREASPDGGINIYINGDENERIYVLGQHGHYYPVSKGENYKEDEFTTLDGVKGTLYYDSPYDYERSKGRKTIYLVLGEGFHGAYLTISDEILKQYNDEILSILKSIKIFDADLFGCVKLFL